MEQPQLRSEGEEPREDGGDRPLLLCMLHATEQATVARWAEGAGLVLAEPTRHTELPVSFFPPGTLVLVDDSATANPVDDCRRLRALGLRPVYILSAGGSCDIFELLREGAVDFVRRPFRWDDLFARLSHLHHVSPPKRLERGARYVQLGRGLVLDLEARCVKVNGREVALPRRKFEVLAYLVEHSGRAVSADELVQASVIEESQRSRYRIMVLELRAKLGEARSSIRTVRGFGYRFEPLP